MPRVPGPTVWVEERLWLGSPSAWAWAGCWRPGAPDWSGVSHCLRQPPPLWPSETRLQQRLEGVRSRTPEWGPRGDSHASLPSPCRLDQAGVKTPGPSAEGARPSLARTWGEKVLGKWLLGSGHRSGGGEATWWISAGHHRRLSFKHFLPLPCTCSRLEAPAWWLTGALGQLSCRL